MEIAFPFNFVLTSIFPFSEGCCLISQPQDLLVKLTTQATSPLTTTLN